MQSIIQNEHMKKVLLTLAIIFIGFFGALAQSSTTLKISLYPVQIIEFDTSIENDDLEPLSDGNLSTFSTSGFNVKVISTDEDEYNSNIELNPHSNGNVANESKGLVEIDNNNATTNQVLINNTEIMETVNSLENRMAVYSIPDIVYSIEAL